MSDESTRSGRQAIGRYEHYKGAEYSVIGIATHTETSERFVIYRTDDMPEGEFYARPEDMFFDTVAVNGLARPRFKKEG